MRNLEDLNGVDDEDTDAIEGAGTPMAFSGGVGTLTYRIQSAVNVPDAGVTYNLVGSMLSVTVAGNVTAQANDMVIMVEATDDNDADDVAHVNVRLNSTPTIQGTQELFVGTQADPAGEGENPDYFASDDEGTDAIVCAMLNECKIKISATDTNLQDVLDWTALVSDADAKKVMVSVKRDLEGSNLDAIITITGIDGAEAGDEAITVEVFAQDEGGYPMLAEEDDATTTERDESKRPAQVYALMVTIDAQPSLGGDSIEHVTLDEINQTKSVATVLDEDSENLMLTVEVDMNVLIVGWDVADTTYEDGRRIAVTSVNSETTGELVKIKVTEPTTQTDGPVQYFEEEFMVTVDL